MANEIIRRPTRAPAEIEARPSWVDEYFPDTTADDDEWDIAGGAPISVLSIENKEWAVKYRKETSTVLNNDGYPAQFIDVVLAKAKPETTKTYYEGDFVPGSNAKPVCSSTNGITPDDNVPEKQNEVCKTCKWDKFGTALIGTGKRCKDSKRVAVLPESDIPNSEYGGPMLLRVPASSFNNLGNYITEQKRLKRPMHAVVTRMSFEGGVVGTIIQFEHLRWLTKEEIDIVNEIRTSDHIDRVLQITDTEEHRETLDPEAVDAYQDRTAPLPNGPVQQSPAQERTAAAAAAAKAQTQQTASAAKAAAVVQPKPQAQPQAEIVPLKQPVAAAPTSNAQAAVDPALEAKRKAAALAKAKAQAALAALEAEAAEAEAEAALLQGGGEPTPADEGGGENGGGGESGGFDDLMATLDQDATSV